jgi:ketosteroid isomerase-like protein
VSALDEVRRAAAALVAAFGRGDMEAYFGGFTADATFLFHSTDALLPSAADYRSEWTRWEDEQDYGVLDCRTSDTDVRLHGEDTAVLTHRVRTTVTASGATSVLHERETIVFRRQDDGRWLAVHEHLSPAP